MKQSWAGTRHAGCFARDTGKAGSAEISEMTLVKALA